MPATFYTDAMLQTLNEAIATGAREVYYGDKRVTYRSLDEMMRIRNIMLEELGYSDAGGGRKYAEFNDGLKSGCQNNNQSFLRD